MGKQEPTVDAKEASVVVKTAGGAEADKVAAPAAAGGGEGKSTLFLAASTALLILQTSVYFLMMQYTQAAGRASGTPYNGGVAVLLQEVLKMLFSFGVHAWSLGSASEAWSDMVKMMVETPQDSLMLLVPGVLYVVQNNLLYFASSVISASEAQILMQLKMLTTAVFSMFLLNKRFSWAQWGALTMLACGCALVEASSMDRETTEEADAELETSASGSVPQRSEATISSTSTATTTTGTTTAAATGARSLAEQVAATPAILGVAAALTGATTSGLAGVSIEKLLKSKGSMWVRNTHLAFWSVLISLVLLLLRDQGRAALSGGLTTMLQGFTPAVWFTVVLGSAGGLLVALVLKYLDSIVKNMAAAASIILCATVNLFLSGEAPDPTYVLGTVLVVTAVVVYQYAPPPPADAPKPDAPRSDTPNPDAQSHTTNTTNTTKPSPKAATQ
jgi:solute carrier family 35 (UDP-sugar transporter), member A1/2/3